MESIHSKTDNLNMATSVVSCLIYLNRGYNSSVRWDRDCFSETRAVSDSIISFCIILYLAFKLSGGGSLGKSRSNGWKGLSVCVSVCLSV